VPLAVGSATVAANRPRDSLPPTAGAVIALAVAAVSSYGLARRVRSVRTAARRMGKGHRLRVAPSARVRDADRCEKRGGVHETRVPLQKKHGRAGRLRVV